MQRQFPVPHSGNVLNRIRNLRGNLQFNGIAFEVKFVTNFKQKTPLLCREKKDLMHTARALFSNLYNVFSFNQFM